MIIEMNPHRVVNQLKKLVNAQCEDGFVWFTDVTDEGMSMYDLMDAIKILEKAEVKHMEVTDE